MTKKAGPIFGKQSVCSKLYMLSLLDQVADVLTVQAEFRKLNILLHCPVLTPSSQSLRPPNDSLSPTSGSHIAVSKVAMISMTGARVDASMGESACCHKMVESNPT